MKDERGQALPVAIVALAIGALVVVPFLSHAGSSLIGSKVHGNILAEQSAADAGVEHAIWSLTWGNLARQFTHAGDQVSYQLEETINGFNPAITITANVTSQNGTLGDIANAVIDTLVFDNSTCYLPSMIMVSSNICAVAYRGPSNRGYVKTVSISANGDIGSSAIDTLTFDGSACYEPKIINVATGIYAIAYRGSSNRGYLKTVTISASGVIGGSVISTLTFDSSSCYEPAIINVSGTIYAIAYRQSSNLGYLKTMSISTSGVIGGSVISTLNFDTSACYTPSIIMVSNNVSSITYRGSSNKGYLKTVSISASGVIGSPVINTLIFDASACYEPDIVNVSGSTFAIAYRQSANQGYLKTISISASGIIGTSAIDTLIFDPSACYEPSIVYVSGNVDAIAYRGSGNHGYLKTMSIAANGDIGASVIDTLQFDASNGYEPVIVKVTGGIFAIAYRAASTHGNLITVGISTQTAVPALWQIVSNAGNTTIRAMVNTANTTATIVSWQIH
ncbi:MAG: hypothetical protein ABR958_07195 [Dehalococcoidales bacterium]